MSRLLTPSPLPRQAVTPLHPSCSWNAGIVLWREVVTASLSHGILHSPHFSLILALARFETVFVVVCGWWRVRLKLATVVVLRGQKTRQETLRKQRRLLCK